MKNKRSAQIASKVMMLNRRVRARRESLSAMIFAGNSEGRELSFLLASSSGMHDNNKASSSELAFSAFT